jgi:surface polysaccharide O-acyltransferase-like enzyme
LSGWLGVAGAEFFRVVIMKSDLDKMIEERQTLQTQLVQVQSMLYLIDYYISEELLAEVDVKGKAS